MRILLISDPGIADLEGAVKRALAELPAGAAAVQLRDRERGGRALLAMTERLRAICRARGARLLVNDRMDVALAACADGIHLRRDSASVAEARALGFGLVGMSTHSEEQVREAAGQGADYVVFGPVFFTPGKGRPLGLGALQRASAQGVPVFALGGVDQDNAAACLQAGAAGVAGIRMVLGRADVAEGARRLAKAVFP